MLRNKCMVVYLPDITYIYVSKPEKIVSLFITSLFKSVVQHMKCDHY